MQARPAGGEASNRIAEPWGQRAPYGPGAAWPVRVDTFLNDGVTPEQVDRWVPSARVLCSNGGLDIAVASGRMVGVRGRANDRVNHGRLGPKGLFGGGARLALAGGWRMEFEFDIGSVPSASPTSRSAASPIVRLADAGAPASLLDGVLTARERSHHEAELVGPVAGVRLHGRDRPPGRGLLGGGRGGRGEGPERWAGGADP